MIHGDISENLTLLEIDQRFAPMRVTVLCLCHWWLKEWHVRNLCFPSWRIYWVDREDAAELYTHTTRFPLGPEYLMLISPNTLFSKRLINGDRLLTDDDPDCFHGGQVLANTLASVKIAEPQADAVKIFFLHFTLGVPCDMLSRKIYRIPLSVVQKDRLKQIMTLGTELPGYYPFHETIKIHAFITDALGQIPSSDWPEHPKDPRIQIVLKSVDASNGQVPSNKDFAEQANMSTEAFIRLFRKEIGMTPHRYALTKRIEQAAILLQYTNKTIDSIALECGFTDRNYFTRIFTRTMGVAPANYRQYQHLTKL